MQKAKTKEKKRKKYPRPTTARFTTEESKVLLRAMRFSQERNQFWEENPEYLIKAHEIIRKLNFRIEAEGKKKNENGEGNKGDNRTDQISALEDGEANVF